MLEEPQRKRKGAHRLRIASEEEQEQSPPQAQRNSQAHHHKASVQGQVPVPLALRACRLLMRRTGQELGKQTAPLPEDSRAR